MSAGEPDSPLTRRHEVPDSDLAEAVRLVEAAERLAEAELEKAAALGATVLTLDDRSYPERLRDLELPPPVLYCRGRLPSKPAIAIVGSRSASPEGLETAELFGRELASRGLTVVSGFARGVDHAAHRGALASDESGCTLAVLGCGLAIDYPRQRREMRAAIAERGALVSEFPCTAPPSKLTFPIRNRLIAAWTLGTLVVQGARRSGSLITARLAADLGRDVYAVPGSIYDSRAEGPNALIQDGALLVTRPEEIVESLPHRIRLGLAPTTARYADVPPQGLPARVLDQMTGGSGRTADELATLTELSPEEVLGALLELEVTGRVKRHPGARFCRRS